VSGAGTQVWLPRSWSPAKLECVRTNSANIGMAMLAIYPKDATGQLIFLETKRAENG